MKIVAGVDCMRALLNDRAEFESLTYNAGVTSWFTFGQVCG